MKYKKIVLELLTKLDHAGGINCVGKERYKTCEWNKLVKYDNSNLYAINDDKLANKKVCEKCLLEDIKKNGVDNI